VRRKSEEPRIKACPDANRGDKNQELRAEIKILPLTKSTFYNLKSKIKSPFIPNS
jgi:hypothetical protein